MTDPTRCWACNKLLKPSDKQGIGTCNRCSLVYNRSTKSTKTETK